MKTRLMLALALIAAPASAQAMSVHEFLSKANALKKKGIFALGSPDIGLLKREMAGVMKDFKADGAAARRAGRPLTCPPAGAKMSKNEFLKSLEAIPPAQRGISMKSAFYALLKAKYPCPA